jgi:hypothetical protein
MPRGIFAFSEKFWKTNPKVDRARKKSSIFVIAQWREGFYTDWPLPVSGQVERHKTPT